MENSKKATLVKYIMIGILSKEKLQRRNNDADDMFHFRTDRDRESDVS